MVDERAVYAAIQGYASVGPMRAPDTWTFDAIKAAIEAYEAAKWRPIEEAPRDGTTIQISSKKLQRPYPIFGNWEDADWGGPGFRVGCVLLEIDSRHLQGAMFLTIDPPPQNAVSRGTSTPPAAEASS